MSPDSLLRMRGVHRNYGNVIALAGIELEMHRGEAVVLLGPNGAGKTTLARIAAGYLEPSSGTVKLSGATVHNPGDLEVRSQVAFVADVPALYDDLTVLEHVELLALAYGVTGDLKPRLEGLIDVFGLQRHSNFLPGQLSRGLRQKTQLACTFVRPFSLLILDEPSAGLDPPAKAKLKEMLVELTTQDRGVLFTTHELDLARGLAHRAIILTDGRIIADGEFDPISSAWLDQLGSS